MLDIIRKEYTNDLPQEEKINRVREFLQVLLLKVIYDLGFFKNLAFTGGTALRLIYDLRRFSEDLDFSIIVPKGYSFNGFIDKVKSRVEAYGINIEIKQGREKTVQSAMVKFVDLLYKLELSNMKSQKLFIRLEVDTKPPKGWDTESSLINKSYIFAVTHFTLSSLYATKLHACFYRKYTKGRDFYDLLWYFGKKIEPNYILLNSAICQTEDKSVVINESNFKQFLKERISRVDFKKVRADVERFLVDKNELQMLDGENILSLIR